MMTTQYVTIGQWTVTLDIGHVYIQHRSLDSLIIDATSLEVVEDDLGSREIPGDVVTAAFVLLQAAHPVDSR
jgi:hypothetical protein